MREIKFRAWDKNQKEMFQNASTGTVQIFDGEKIASSNTCDFMQFTGLLDKNGKEIYEGDLLRHIAFPVSSAQPVDFKRGMFICQDMSISTYHSSTIEVIGNIYENPELCEAQHD